MWKNTTPCSAQIPQKFPSVCASLVVLREKKEIWKLHLVSNGQLLGEQGKQISMEHV